MKKFLTMLPFVILLALLNIAAYQIGSYYLEDYKAEQQFHELATRYNVTDQEAIVTEENVSALQKSNEDMIGWLRIDNTPIDYPVMWTPEDGQFYLHRTFDKSYSKQGTPFLEAACDWAKPSTNLIIYGHNMKSGAMFGSLSRYKEDDF